MKKSNYKKTITILGATGSIGTSCLSIIAENPELFDVIALTANNNWKKISQIARKFRPKYICLTNDKYYLNLKKSLSDLDISIISGVNALSEIAEIKVDICIAAIVGIAGLSPTLKIVQNCNILGIANKETIVCGGNFIINECKKFNTKIIPVDSEHNSIYQLLEKEKLDQISKIYLTASGGPFLHTDIKDFENITIKSALSHPNWKMGNKITIDSATMVNKGLELIEAYFLFNIKKDKLDVVIHPESIVHALVTFDDGAIKSLLGVHDMRVAISYVFGYPKRIKQDHLQFNFLQPFSLNFSPPDLLKFRALYLAQEVLKQEGIMPVVFNAANEILVNMFLDKKIKFVDIVSNIEKVLNSYSNIRAEGIEHICEIDTQARKLSLEILKK